MLGKARRLLNASADEGRTGVEVDGVEVPEPDARPGKLSRAVTLEGAIAGDEG